MSKPAFLWEPFSIEVGRTADYRFKLYKSDKKAAALAAGDVVRFKLSLKPDDEFPLLDLRSGAVTSNSSTVTIESLGVEDVTPAVVIVRFAQDDTIDLDSTKQHAGEIGVVDDSETAPPDAFKRAGYGPVDVLPSAGGNVGLT